MVFAQIGITMFSYLGVFMLSILFHELAHLQAIYAFTGKRVPMQIMHEGKFKYSILAGSEADYDGMSNEQISQVYTVGVGSGVLVILFAATVNIYFLLLMGPYLLISEDDIRRLWLIKTNKIEWKQK